MRIVVCGPAHPFRGGIATTTTAMVEALRGRGHSVEFLTPVRQYPRLLYPGGDVRDPEACAPVDGARAVFAPFEPWTWPGMRRAAREFGADAWILPFWTWAWAPMWRFLLAPRGRPAAIGIVHNLSDHDAGVARRRVADGVVSRFDGLMTHARVLGEALERRFPGLPVASHVLPPPSVVPGDLPGRDRARRSLGIGEDQRLAVFLGLIRPYKGVDVLLEAFGHLGGGSPWRLIVAGEAWSGLEKELIDRARALGLGDRVRFHFGWAPEPEIDRLVSAADVVVLPYRSGSQSAVAPLALGRGVPVVASDVGGLGEIVEDGISGVLVPPGSPAALAGVFRELDGDRLLSLRGGASATIGRWTWEGYAEVLETLVERVAGG